MATGHPGKTWTPGSVDWPKFDGHGAPPVKAKRARKAAKKKAAPVVPELAAEPGGDDEPAPEP